MTDLWRSTMTLTADYGTGKFVVPQLEHEARSHVVIHPDDFVRLWNACLESGLPPNKTISKLLDLSSQAVAQRAHNLRERGYDVPRAPSRPPNPGNCPHCGACPSAQRPKMRVALSATDGSERS